MSELCILAFRNVSRNDLGVEVGQVYRVPSVTAATQWRDFALGTRHWVPWDQVRTIFHGKRVCFLVHGFNVSVDHGAKSQSAAAQSFTQPRSWELPQDGAGGAFAQDYASWSSLPVGISDADLIVPVLWPGDGFIATSFFSAANSAKDTGRRFAEFLTNTNHRPSQVSFISHSLGALVVLETIANATAAPRATPPPTFGTAILTAAAVDDNVLDDRDYAAAIGALERIVVVSSWKDSVLEEFFPVGDRILGGNGRALGRFGPVFNERSQARAKTEWFDIRPQAAPNDHGHDHYFPWPWDPCPPWPNGWQGKRARVAALCSGVMESRSVDAALAAWVQDKTSARRTNQPP